MNDEQIFLANAYLDGELTAEERRIAETDPDVMAEVEALRALQLELRAVTAPTDAARESAVSAAMAEFSAGAATVAATEDTVSAAPIPFRPRPAYAKYLAVAAAVVAVAGLGIVISQADLGGDDDDSSAGDAAPAAEESAADDNPFAESVEAGADESAADDGGEDAGDDAAEAEVMASTGEEMSEEAALDTEAAEVADEPADAAADEPADDAAGDESDADTAATTPAMAERLAVPPDFDPDAPIADETELGVFGAYLLRERDAGTLPPTPNTPCTGDDEILDEATLIVDGAATPVYVSVIEFDELVFARSTATCEVILEGSLIAN